MLVLTNDGQKRGRMNTIQYLRSIDYARPRSARGNVLVYDRVDFGLLVARALITVPIRDTRLCLYCGAESQVEYDHADMIISCPLCGTYSEPV